MPTIEIVELFSGIGSLTFALNAGLKEHSNCKVIAASEFDKGYLAYWESQHEDARTFQGDLCKFHSSELSTPRIAEYRVLVAGIPCTGHSGFGISKNKLKGNPEGHKSAGHLFIPTLLYIRKHKPDFVVLENVIGYKKSKAGEIVRNALSKSGYRLQEGVVYPNKEFDTATTRPRWFLIASKAKTFHWEYTPKPFSRLLEDVLDPASPLDIEESFEQHRVDAHTKHLDRKKAQGCNFSRTVIEASSTSCPTIPRTYYKIQPAGPFVKTPGSYRMLRPKEIARIHGFPDDYPTPESRRLAFEGLGQGVCFQPFFEIGKSIGQFLQEQKGQTVL